jgi:hypothetical protein
VKPSDTHREILALREALIGDGTIPTAKTSKSDDLRRAMRSRIVQTVLALGVLGGGGLAADVPGRVSRAMSSADQLLEARVAILERDKESLTKKIDSMDGKLDYLIRADARRAGFEQAMREMRRRKEIE